MMPRAKTFKTVTMSARRLVADPLAAVCSYCKAGKGERCTLTLAPELGAGLSLDWAHRAREAVVSRG